MLDSETRDTIAARVEDGMPSYPVDAHLTNDVHALYEHWARLRGGVSGARWQDDIGRVNRIKEDATSIWLEASRLSYEFARMAEAADHVRRDAWLIAEGDK